MRQAQLSLLYDEDAETRLAARRASLAVVGGEGRTVAGRTDSKHSFHWAPLISLETGCKPLTSKISEGSAHA